jgi:hypothetical protein
VHALQLEEDRIAFEEEQVLFEKQHLAAWELDIQEKHRLEKMLPFKEQFANQIMTRRAEEFAALKVCPTIDPLHGCQSKSLALLHQKRRSLVHLLSFDRGVCLGPASL